MRQRAPLTKGWYFTGPSGKEAAISLPHTWNNVDGQDGGNDYYRGTCTYRISFPMPAYDKETQCVYLEFDGVNASARVTINGKECCRHDGGYSTFRVEVTDHLQRENELVVAVNNGANDRVYPQKADFTFYGGIYRDVSILVLNKRHFNLNFHGGHGLQITPVVTQKDAKVTVETWHNALGAKVTVSILDQEGKQAAFGKGSPVVIAIPNPHLWDGMKDPYLYTVVAQLHEEDQVLDEVRLRFGVRSFYVDPEKGFFLNGRSYPLHGVSRHQDRKALGNRKEVPHELFRTGTSNPHPQGARLERRQSLLHRQGLLHRTP